MGSDGLRPSATRMGQTNISEVVMAIKVFSESYEEEFVWNLAWLLASFSDDHKETKDGFNEALDNYIAGYEPDESGFLFVQEGDKGYHHSATIIRQRTLAFVYEWMLMGHEDSRICFQRFMEARLS